MPTPNPINALQYPAQYINSNIAANYAASVTAGQTGADTTEDTLQTFSLPANLLTLPGQCLKLRAWGSVANNNHTKTLKLYIGATSISITLNASVADDWWAEMEYYFVTENTQIANGRAFEGTSVLAIALATGTDNLGTPLTAKVTGTNGTSGAADIVCNGAVLEFWP